MRRSSGGFLPNGNSGNVLLEFWKRENLISLLFTFSTLKGIIVQFVPGKDKEYPNVEII